MKWFKQQTQWKEEHGYNDPAVTTPELRAWFFDIIKEFPPMNGPYATEAEDESKNTDFSIGKSCIYAAFAWSEAEEACETVFNLAQNHRVGFFDVSSNNGGVWLFDSTGKYSCIHGGEAAGDKGPAP